MTKDRDASSQIHDYHLLMNDLVTEDINLPKHFMAMYLIERREKNFLESH